MTDLRLPGPHYSPPVVHAPAQSGARATALALLLRRSAAALLTAWAAVSLTFFALRLSAGDPVASLLSQGLASEAQAQALRRELGFDRPLAVQYLSFLAGLARGDLGISLYTGRPVVRTIGEQLPATLQLAGSGLAIAVVLGLGLGVLAAWKDRTLLGRASSALAGLATALPVAFTGVLALLAFLWLRQSLPMAFWGWARGLALPALVLGFGSAGALARVVQFGLLDSLRAEYVVGARARGVAAGPRLLWHALRPALPPAISLGALEAAYLFGGTVVTETVFSRPGLGRLLVGAILQGDYAVAQGVVALAALVYTASHLIADSLAMAIDPRLRRRS